MHMRDAAERLGQIIQKLGGGTSTGDQHELEQLHGDMLAAAGAEATPEKPRAPRRKQDAVKKATKTTKPLKGETVKKGRGK